MPNYVSNTIRMEGIANLPLFTEKDGVKAFDFNKIIPMPESLNIEDGSRTQDAIIYYLTERCTVQVENLSLVEKTLFDQLVHLWGTSSPTKEVGAVLKRAQSLGSDSDREALYHDGSIYVSNYQKYGATTWYDWCRKNWGTKWNAINTLVYGHDEVSFDTAWEPPEPVVARLAEMYPGTEIRHIWTYEDEPGEEFEKIYNEKEI